MQDLHFPLNSQAGTGLINSKAQLCITFLGLPFPSYRLWAYIHFWAFRNLCSTFIHNPTHKLKKNNSMLHEQYHVSSCGYRSKTNSDLSEETECFKIH